MNRHATTLGLSLSASAAIAQTATLGGPGHDLTGTGSAFTVVGLPDTQKYSELYPEQFYAQTEWIARNRRARDIRFVSHYGDLVQNGDNLAEWNVADTAMRTLDRAGVPYGVVAGNHDVLPSGIVGQPYIPQNYQQRFNASRYAGRDWFGGASPSGMSTYQTFAGGGEQFIALHLALETPWEELAWAQGVIDANPDKPVMLTTHRYLQDANDYIPDGLEPVTGLAVTSGRYPSIWYGVEGQYAPDGIQAEDFFRGFVRANQNVFLVNAGHFHEEYRQTSTNDYGLPVHEVLADYQDDPMGGNGYMRLMQFDVANSRIDFESYSPTLDSFLTKDESQFSLGVDFSDYRAAEGTTRLAFQDGINAYAGTRDTWINQDNANASYGNSDRIVVDDDTDNSIFSDDRGQGLIRFDGVIGDASVPLGAQVTDARLRVFIEDDVDFLFDADFDVFEMTRDWDEDSTWNSLGGGAEDDRGMYLGRFDGDNDPNGDGWRTIDVTSLVAQWALGTDNLGFLLLPEVISGNDDGIELWSSEAGVALYRPRLEVSFVLPDSFWGPTAVAVPAPASAALLAPLLGAGLHRRRRG